MKIEYMILMKVIKELKWIRNFLMKLSCNNDKSDVSIDLYSNNQSIITLAKNPVSHMRAKYIDIHHHFIHDIIQNQIIWIQYIPTIEMIMDNLTKVLDHEKYEKCIIYMNMTHWCVVTLFHRLDCLENSFLISLSFWIWISSLRDQALKVGENYLIW